MWLWLILVLLVVLATGPMLPDWWRFFCKRPKLFAAIVLLGVSGALLVRFFTSRDADAILMTSRVEVVNGSGKSLTDIELTLRELKDVWTESRRVLDPGDSFREVRRTPDLWLVAVEFSLDGKRFHFAGPDNPCKGRTVVVTIGDNGLIEHEFR